MTHCFIELEGLDRDRREEVRVEAVMLELGCLSALVVTRGSQIIHTLVIR